MMYSRSGRNNEGAQVARGTVAVVQKATTMELVNGQDSGGDDD